MKKTLCLGASKQFTDNLYEQIELIQRAGFDATFVSWDYDLELSRFAETAKGLGVQLQSVHAPFGKMAKLWGESEQEATEAIRELGDCLGDCVKNNIPIVVFHAFIGFKDHTPNRLGLERMAEILKIIENTDTRVAFENTEGIEYLDALMDRFGDNPRVGFCWDTGHEMCYNHSEDLLKKYGGRLFCTHLNDNLGIKSKAEEITWLDDLHLLPFDGVADWEDITARLAKASYKGELTFELNTLSKPGRHENDKYSAMPIEAYLAEAYSRACRVATMLIAKERGCGQGA